MSDAPVLTVLLILVLSIVATEVWRWLGVAIASRLSPESALAGWFRCVAYAVLAGLIARMILLPEGVLAEPPLVDKLVALGCGFAAFFLARRNLVVGTGTAFAVFVAIALWRAGGFP